MRRSSCPAPERFPGTGRASDPEREVQLALERFRAARAELPQAAPGVCTADERTLCLEDGRFRVRADWATQGEENEEEERTGVGKALPLSGDTGMFWFFEPENVQIMIKVLDGCAVNGHRWVFAGGLTNVAVEMTVVDVPGETATPWSRCIGRPTAPTGPTGRTG